MYRYGLTILSLTAFAMPLPALAQDSDISVSEQENAGPLTRMATTLSDPERQRVIALMTRAMGEILLDMPIAPMAKALAETAGKKVPAVKPDTTLRSLAPEAGRIPADVERNLPRAMEITGATALAVKTMLPKLRNMADGMKNILRKKR